MRRSGFASCRRGAGMTPSQPISIAERPYADAFKGTAKYYAKYRPWNQLVKELMVWHQLREGKIISI